MIRAEHDPVVAFHVAATLAAHGTGLDFWLRRLLRFQRRPEWFDNECAKFSTDLDQFVYRCPSGQRGQSDQCCGSVDVLVRVHLESLLRAENDWWMERIVIFGDVEMEDHCRGCLGRQW